MSRIDKKPFRIYGIYDTETCNIGVDNETRAYPILFIYNDVHTIDLKDYVFDKTDNISFYRRSAEFRGKLQNVIETAKYKNEIPVVCAYNLMFDLQPLMYELNKEYEIKANAQTSTNAYTVDIIENDEIVLRFWDTFFLEMNGLRAMGETCGLPKAVGDWDYTLVRTQETPLTELELHYAKRDVQVIPAYLQYLIRSNEWLTSDMLACTVLTKTSLVRQFAKLQIGKLKYEKNNKNGFMTLRESMYRLAKQEFPQCYNQYALRKACFRGGLTFTAANNANRVWENVASLDVTSMHHTFINGRKLPVHFKLVSPNILDIISKEIIETSLDSVLKSYDKPFNYAVHELVTFTNIRLRKNSVFEKNGIGIIPESKFTLAAPETDLEQDDRAKLSEEEIRKHGFHDYAKYPIFAFGKLMKASYAEIFLNEVELWNIAQVYEWDKIKVRYGECTPKFVTPPDYVTLQSNILFKRKTDMKKILATYKEGSKYIHEIPASIPEGIAMELKNGTAETMFLNAYYNSTVKGMFNGIYGTQAMDLLKPNFLVKDGSLVIDAKSVCTPENFASKIPKRPMVVYTYGMRIVAGSRMHLIIALMLLHDKLHNTFIPTGGDTDSIKCALASDVTDKDIMRSLKALHDATDIAIESTMQRVRKNYPEKASKLCEIGHFEIEACGSANRWEHHFEAWNKARVSENNGEWHVTCAGLSRPRGMYTIEDWCKDMKSAGNSFEAIANAIFGYDTFITNAVSHSLEHHRPEPFEMYREVVTDYLGNSVQVCEYQSISLYPTGRWLGETTKRAPRENVKWLEEIGVDMWTSDKIITVENGVAKLYTIGDDGDYEPSMIGVV